MARRGMGGARRQLGRVVRKARAVYRQVQAPAQSGTGGERTVVDLARRNEAFFDVEWYGAQTGRVFASRDSAVAHAHRFMDQRSLSPHPLYMPMWRRAGSSQKRVPSSERYLELFSPGWPTGRPHPLVDLEHVATQHPASVEDPDGVFGWLLKRLASGAPLDALPDVSVPWADARAGQLSAALASRAESDRLRRWHAGRDAEKYDWAADAACVRDLTAQPVDAPSDRPLVTVVMPAYNRARQIEAAIESVQAQTLSSWELVIADDGSSDETVEVARRYAADDERITVLELAHGGVSAARNAAIRTARGRWVAFLDTDNTWVPHFLAAMVSALTTAGAVHGYSALKVEDDSDVTTYRTLEGADTLDIGNHVDLNIWMVDADRLREVGMFDETLRRAVDYDLVWRVAELEQPRYVPFVGSHYSARSDGAERITDVEAFNWKEVVRNKRLVDWPALPGRERTAGVSAVVVCYNDTAQDISRTLRHLGRTADVDEVLVVGATSSRYAGLVVHAERSLSPKIRQVDTPSLSPVSLLANIGFSHTARTHVLFLRPGTTLPDDGVAALTAAVVDGSAVAQPVLLDSREVVLQAGLRFLDHPDAAVPSRFLEGHPSEDVGGLPDAVRSHAASLSAMLTSAQTFIELGGFDPLLGNYWFDADYCLRAFDVTGRPVTTCTRVVGQARDRKDLGWGQAVKSAAGILDAKRELRLDALDDHWADTPFEVVGTEFDGPVGENAFLKPPRPVLRLRAEDRGSGERLRIAVKHCAPPGEDGDRWGDLYFARQLADALGRRGHDVVVDNRESAQRPTAALDEVNIVIRGVRPIHPVPGAVNVLWIISRPDRVRPEELVGFDHVYAASVPWAARASVRFGRDIRPLPQATDVHTFFPRPRDAVEAPAALFVGNRRAEYRRPVADGMLLAAEELDVGIYGGRWHRDGVGPPVLRGEFIANADLPLYYSAAGIVLNDHFPTMREQGFLNNRILDALACGTPVLSDHVPGAEEMFGDRVLWYTEAQEIPGVLRQYFAAPWSEDERGEVARWVAANHSFDARAEVLLDAVAATDRERSTGRTD